MAEIREAVDDGHRAVLREILDLLLVEGADHDAVHIAGEHARGILHRLAAADLRALAREYDGVAAELVDAHLERNARSGGGFLKDHAERLALQVRVLDAVLRLVLELVGEVEDLEDLLPREVEEL